MHAYKSCSSTRTAHAQVYAYVFDPEDLHRSFKSVVLLFVKFLLLSLIKYAKTLNLKHSA